MTRKGRGTYNVVGVGAGAAGMVTAGLGGWVAVIERNSMGGDRLNFGCERTAPWSTRRQTSFLAPAESGDSV